MIDKQLLFVLPCAAVTTFLSVMIAQTVSAPAPAPTQPKINSYPTPADIPYPRARPEISSDTDRFIGDWRESLPRFEHGSLVLRDILTRGDEFSPPHKGAVLIYANFLAYGTLAAHASTGRSRLPAQQEMFYILSGAGKMMAAGDTVELHKDIVVLLPARLDFAMNNTGDEPLTMYVINEPCPAGFRPNEKLLVRDEGAPRPPHAPITSTPYITPGAAGHWSHITHSLFGVADGLGTIQSLITVALDPLTLGEPHPHRPPREEVWLALEGTSLAWLGTDLRIQRPGMAFNVRPDGQSTHSNINYSDHRVKFLWFACSGDHALRK